MENDYKPQAGTWRLIAPDGRIWESDSPLKVVSKESNERIPAEIRLARIMEAISEPDPEMTDDARRGPAQEVPR